MTEHVSRVALANCGDVTHTTRSDGVVSAIVFISEVQQF